MLSNDSVFNNTLYPSLHEIHQFENAHTDCIHNIYNVHVGLQTKQLPTYMYSTHSEINQSVGFASQTNRFCPSLAQWASKLLGKFLRKSKLQTEVLNSKRQTFGGLVRMIFRIGHHGYVVGLICMFLCSRFITKPCSLNKGNTNRTSLKSF